MFGHPTHIGALGTFLCKSGQGRLGSVCISTRGQGGNFLTLRDGLDASGPILAVIDCANAPVGAIIYDAALATGCFATYAGGVAGDVTVLTD